MSAAVYAGALKAIATRAAREKAMAPASDPNVIPFIDVLMVLLVIFMVTAPLPTVDIKVDLPTHSAAPPEGIRPTLVEMRETGFGGVEVSIDGAVVEMHALEREIVQRALANNPALDTEQLFADARIFVRADQNIAYGNVVMVMDVVREAGFVQVGIFAETANEG